MREAFTARRVSGAVVLTAIVAFALVWPLVAPASMTAADYLHADLPPSVAHPMGTDALGRDLSVLVARALRLSLAVAAGAATMAGLVGMVVGAAAAAGGRHVDGALMRVTDAVAAVPHLLATVVVVALFRGSLAAIVLALALTHWPAVARVVRAEAQEIMTSGFVAASRAAGASPAQLARWHVVPAVAAQAGLAMALMVPHAVWHESTLSFLGIGLSPERPSLGTLVAMSQSEVLLGRWWPLVFPTAALLALTAAVALLGPGRAGRGRTGHGRAGRCRTAVRGTLGRGRNVRGGAGPVGHRGRMAPVDETVPDDDDIARTSPAALQVDDLVVRHTGGARAGVPRPEQLPGAHSGPAVDGVSLQVTPGRVVALVGPSGAGKSSLLDACAGLGREGSVVEGRILVGRVGRVGVSQAAPFRVGAVGHIPQSAADAFTPTRHLRTQLQETLDATRAGARRPARARVGPAGADTALAPDRAEELAGADGVDGLCRLAGIDPSLADRYPHQLSGGQLRRMAIALALSTGPTVLLADEPTAGLDPALAADLLQGLRRLADQTGIAVVLGTHDLAALRVCGAADQILEMNAGRLVPAAHDRGRPAPDEPAAIAAADEDLVTA